jgi:Uma2 family endonuclease
LYGLPQAADMYQPKPPRPASETLPTMDNLPSEDPDEPDPSVPHPRPAWETLPTMDDLPSEDPEEPGLPDEFHDFQPQLLRETCRPAASSIEQFFTAADLNLYYDVNHPLWHKRPDWFLVLGKSAAQTQQELRRSYVIWQEGVSPFLVVELLSPGTEAEDLGQTLRTVDRPPTKWQVYEQILRIPYYVFFDRYQNQLRVFQIVGTRYQEMTMPEPKFWFTDLELGLGVWQGTYQSTEGRWLRWYNAQGGWIPLPEEQVNQERQRADQERQRADQERQRAEQLAARLRELGIDLNDEMQRL